jgi:ribosome-associated translation inhibitor RaiA
MEGIHCKLSFNNNGQFRRFMFSGKTFVELRDQVKNLLGLTNDQFQLCYLDNEGDMIIISSDEELSCATTFSKDVLRIFVDPPHKGSSQTKSAQFPTFAFGCAPSTSVAPHVPTPLVQSSSTETTAPSSVPTPHDVRGVPYEDDAMDDGSRFGHYNRNTHWHGHHHMRGSGGRGGCRRGRHGGPHGRHGGDRGGNWRDFKKDKISVEIALLKSLLDQEGEISEHTKSKLEKKLNKLEKKMEKIDSFKCDFNREESAGSAASGAEGVPPSSYDNCKRERKNQTRELWIKIKAKKAELRAAEREGRDEAIIKDLVSQLNALKFEKAAMYQ